MYFLNCMVGLMKPTLLLINHYMIPLQAGHVQTAKNCQMFHKSINHRILLRNICYNCTQGMLKMLKIVKYCISRSTIATIENVTIYSEIVRVFSPILYKKEKHHTYLNICMKLWCFKRFRW